MALVWLMPIQNSIEFLRGTSALSQLNPWVAKLVMSFNRPKKLFHTLHHFGFATSVLCTAELLLRDVQQNSNELPNQLHFNLLQLACLDSWN